MDLLLHTCCGPCATAVVPFWRSRGLKITGLFFNPNIHPLLEWRRRATGARDACDFAGVDLVEDPSYDPAAWFDAVVPGEGTRCRRCIGQRLMRTAEEAAARGFSGFSTTLAVSPYQEQEAIRSAGQEASVCHDVEFLYEDLRPRYGESRRLSKEWGLYRQKYCGCLLSEWERYRGA